jgi:hypothetical protein
MVKNQNPTTGEGTAPHTTDSDNSKALRVPPQLPVALSEWHRFLKSERTINDHVEDAHRALLDSEQAELYRSYLWAVYDEQAVEGSLAADNIESARLIRVWAKENKSELAREKLATIAKALGVVLRRYHASRKERRQMVAGEVVSNEEN